MGTALHGDRSTDWAFCPHRSRHTWHVSDFWHFDSYRCSHLGYDLPDDDEGGFSEHKTDWEEPERAFGHVGDKLADQAFHYVWNCLPVFVCRDPTYRWYSDKDDGHAPACANRNETNVIARKLSAAIMVL